MILFPESSAVDITARLNAFGCLNEHSYRDDRHCIEWNID